MRTPDPLPHELPTPRFAAYRVRIPVVVLVSMLMLVLFVFSGLAEAQTRERVPAPEGGGQGETSYAPDLSLVGGVPLDPERTRDWIDEQRGYHLDPVTGIATPLSAAKSTPIASSKRVDIEIGGDDVVVLQDDWIQQISMDIASNGDIYIALSRGVSPATQFDLRVYRSQDGGDSWQLWGEIADGAFNEQVSLVVAEGIQNRCYVAYAHNLNGFNGETELRVSYADLSAPTADFASTAVVVADITGYDFGYPALVADDIEYGDYFVYLAFGGTDPGASGRDIWFTRSLDFGASWESGYQVASSTGSGYDYVSPTLSYGVGGGLFLTWLSSSPTGAFPNDARYRIASNFASAGLGDWDSIHPFWAEVPDVGHGARAMAARSSAPNEILMMASRYDVSGPGYALVTDTAVRPSSDGGATFDQWYPIEGEDRLFSDLREHPSTGDWIMALGADRPSLRRSPTGAYTDWGSLETFYDQPYASQVAYKSPIAFDPTRGNRIARCWVTTINNAPDFVYFDAEWRADPGYPNVEDGFPLALSVTPTSPPALADLDRDGTLEIVFGTSNGEIQVIEADGGSRPGWPVDVGVLSDGPIAIGDLNGDGEFAIVAGDNIGQVWAFDVDGQALPGFPFTFPNAYPVQVSIGALGGPYPRTIVATCDKRLEFINYRGTLPLDTFGWVFALGSFTTPCAIGDIDADGIAEAVGAIGTLAFAVQMYDSNVQMTRTLGSVVSDAVTLGDLDQDGDVEILVPTEDGILYALQGDGSDFAGSWPFTTPTATPLTSAAIANTRGTSSPEIAVAARNWMIHMLYSDGVDPSGYPVFTGGSWYLRGAPVIGIIEGASADVIIGSRDEQAYCWDNYGNPIPGWSKSMPDKVELSPAHGDIDNDGRTEIVFLTSTSLVVLDVGSVPDLRPLYRWPMYGHDFQRTGCWNCAEDVVTSSDPASDPASTRVFFAVPAPNPTSSATVFRFVVPSRADVSLAIYDVRGRRIRELTESVVDAGEHALAWDGRDHNGRSLASGSYFARLRVVVNGREETLTRRVTLVR